MNEIMSEKTEIQVDARFRLTLPDELKNHLKLKKGDDIWYEITRDGKIIIGRIEVNKKIIE